MHLLLLLLLLSTWQGRGGGTFTRHSLPMESNLHIVFPQTPSGEDTEACDKQDKLIIIEEEVNVKVNKDFLSVSIANSTERNDTEIQQEEGREHNFLTHLEEVNGKVPNAIFRNKTERVVKNTESKTEHSFLGLGKPKNRPKPNKRPKLRKRSKSKNIPKPKETAKPKEISNPKERSMPIERKSYYTKPKERKVSKRVFYSTKQFLPQNPAMKKRRYKSNSQQFLKRNHVIRPVDQNLYHRITALMGRRGGKRKIQSFSYTKFNPYSKSNIRKIGVNQNQPAGMTTNQPRFDVDRLGLAPQRDIQKKNEIQQKSHRKSGENISPLGSKTKPLSKVSEYRHRRVQSIPNPVSYSHRPAHSSSQLPKWTERKGHLYSVPKENSEPAFEFESNIKISLDTTGYSLTLFLFSQIVVLGMFLFSGAL